MQSLLFRPLTYLPGQRLIHFLSAYSLFDNIFDKMRLIATFLILFCWAAIDSCTQESLLAVLWALYRIPRIKPRLASTLTYLLLQLLFFVSLFLNHTFQCLLLTPGSVLRSQSLQGLKDYIQCWRLNLGQQHADKCLPHCFISPAPASIFMTLWFACAVCDV